MDRQPNDRLGWIPPPRAFEHRRQILRGCGNTHTNANPYAYRNRNSYSYADAYSNSHSHTDAYTDCNSDSYTYGNSNTYRDSNANPNPNIYSNCVTYAYRYANTHPDTDPMHGEMRTHAEAAPDSGTAPVACNVSWKRFYTSRVTPGQILRSTPVKARNDNSITRNQRRP